MENHKSVTYTHRPKHHHPNSFIHVGVYTCIYILDIFACGFQKSNNCLNLRFRSLNQKLSPQKGTNSFVWKARAKKVQINTRTSGQHHPLSVTMRYFSLLQIPASFTSQISSGNQTAHAHQCAGIRRAEPRCAFSKARHQELSMWPYH